MCGNNTTIFTRASTQVDFLLIAIYFVWFIGILINIFGIYCLQKQKNGAFLNQRILLQNLSVVMIVTCMDDTVTLSLYYFRYDWYQYIYFDIIKINVMSVVFVSIILVTLDRLSYILYRARYNRSINTVFLKESLITIWIISFTIGPFIWALAANSLTKIKVYYYVILDTIVFLTASISYVSLIRLVQSGSQRTSQLDLGIGNRYISDMKMLRVPYLIITTYALLCATPDIIFGFYQGYLTMKIKLLLRAASILIYPLTYILFDEKTRQNAVKALRVSKFCRQQAVETTPRNTSVLAVTFRNSIVRNDSDASRISFRIPSF